MSGYTLDATRLPPTLKPYLNLNLMTNSTKQLSLISLYGEKEAHLRKLIKNCIQKIQQSSLRSLFKPYDIEQIHATIIGMEKTTQPAALYNQNIQETTQQCVPMIFDRFLPIIHQCFPMSFQFGGFHPSFNGFTSLGALPYLRSFQIQWESERVTIIGWPQINSEMNHQPSHPKILCDIRSDLETECNIAHKYKNDNDLFMVIGKIVKPKNLLSSETLQLQQDTLRLETSIREYLCQYLVNITIDLNSLYIAQYQSINLPKISTTTHALNNPNLNTEMIKKLYK